MKNNKESINFFNSNYKWNKTGLLPVSRPDKQIPGFFQKVIKSYENSDFDIKIRFLKLKEGAKSASLLIFP